MTVEAELRGVTGEGLDLPLLALRMEEKGYNLRSLGGSCKQKEARKQICPSYWVSKAAITK